MPTTKEFGLTFLCGPLWFLSYEFFVSTQAAECPPYTIFITEIRNNLSSTHKKKTPPTQKKRT
jgi:hypothetical protein